MAFVHGVNTDVYVNGYDVTPYLSKAEREAMVDTPETTTFGATGKTYLPGVPDMHLTFEGLFDGGVAPAIDKVMQTIFGLDPSTWIYLPAGDGFGAIGVGADTIAADYKVTSDIGDAVKVSAEAQGKSGFEPVAMTHPKGAETATGNDPNAAQDNGAASTNGATGFLEVFAQAGTTPTLDVVIQHSTDNSTYVDLLTIPQVTGAQVPIARRAVLAAGTTINRYIRSRRTVGGSGGPSFTYAVGFSRK